MFNILGKQDKAWEKQRDKAFDTFCRKMIKTIKKSIKTKWIK